MEMPIISPSMVSYADELNFNKLLEDLLRNKHNGFIRVTFGSNEGYILFKNGNQIAASYDRYSKLEAVKRIKSIIQENDTLIEVFNLKESPVDYLINVNKPYLIESSDDIYDILNELKKSDHEEITETDDNIESKSLKQDLESESKNTTEAAQLIPKPVEIKPKTITSQTINQTEAYDEDKSNLPLEKESDIESSNSEVKLKQSNPLDTKEILLDNKIYSKESESEEEIQIQSEVVEDIENKSIEEESINRLSLLKKYGIKEIDETEVENILYSYNGGSIDDSDIEKIELTLMNKIKKSILGIPKIISAEVLVFLDNAYELAGTANIIIEYEGKGFFSRMRGESRYTENLRRQIINIAQIEIRKSFRKYPEIINNFDINVEIN
jgi:hypothetical protein